jgi:telomere length regulation protein
MEGLLNLGNPQSASKVRGNIDKFESLSLKESKAEPSSSSTKSKRSILEISSTSSDMTRDSFDNQLTQQTSTTSSQTSVATTPTSISRKKRESVAFIQKAYLDRESEQPTDSLPDDAREILKSKPDYEDLLAVLQYLECGTQRKHDFNVHSAGPKAAQIVNALVTVTVPDHWPVLRIHKLPRRQQQLKQLIVLNLRSVAGLGALVLQIRNLSGGKSGGSSILEDTISVLQLVLQGSAFLKDMLHEASHLYTKHTQRRIWWQELTSLVAGSKVLSYATQAVAAASLTFSRFKWLSEGNEYCEWLARNISTAAAGVDGKDSEAWAMLSQMMKRALYLGYRGLY